MIFHFLLEIVARYLGLPLVVSYDFPFFRRWVDMHFDTALVFKNELKARLSACHLS